MKKDLWILPFPRHLWKGEFEKINQEIREFVENWMSHGKKTPGDYFSRYQQFFMVINTNPVSGCSIDSLMHLFKRIKENFGIEAIEDFFFYRSRNGEIVSIKRYQIKEKIKLREIDLNTIVFNNYLGTKKEFLEKPWESNIKKSWVFQQYYELFNSMENQIS